VRVAVQWVTGAFLLWVVAVWRLCSPDGIRGFAVLVNLFPDYIRATSWVGI